jgi:cytochrome c oxidase subunit 2
MKLSNLLGMTEVASAHGYQIDNLLGLIHLFMLVLFVGWGTFFIYTLIRFNKKANPKASYTGVKGKFSTQLEIAVVVVEVIILVGFAFPLWSERVDAFPDASKSTVARVVGEQYAWNIHYPGPDGIFGSRKIEFVNASNPLGLDSTDHHADDDIITINQLHLPVDKPVILYISSKDVIHSFAVREMRVLQDATPGLTIPMWFTPTVSGKYEISCSQLCGLGHYRMRGFLTVESEDEFNAWMDEQAVEKLAAGSIDPGMYD